MKHYEFAISDYEHSGDLEWAKREIRAKFPKVENLNGFEERDYEAEFEFQDEYGTLDEPIYKGYIGFDAPDEYVEDLNNYRL